MKITVETVADLIALAEKLKDLPPQMRIVNACREGRTEDQFNIVVEHKTVYITEGGYLTEPWRDEHKIKSFGIVQIS